MLSLLRELKIPLTKVKLQKNWALHFFPVLLFPLLPALSVTSKCTLLGFLNCSLSPKETVYTALPLGWRWGRGIFSEQWFQNEVEWSVNVARVLYLLPPQCGGVPDSLISGLTLNRCFSQMLYKMNKLFRCICWCSSGSDVFLGKLWALSLILSTKKDGRKGATRVDFKKINSFP